MTFHHDTVLLHEAVEGLQIKSGGTYIDCTLGGAGHTSLILDKLQGTGRVIAFDQDITAIENAEKKLKEAIDAGKLILVPTSFIHLKTSLESLGVFQVDGILYDLGVSSPQFDNAERGFSYNQEAKLDMRMDKRQKLTAFQIVNHWEYKDLVRIFFRYGEEKFSKPIAREIERKRAHNEIQTTFDLVEIVKKAIPAAARRTGGHPAKRVFQALRIAVNNEIEAIEESLDQAVKLLDLKGRLCVITFHSLEDRLVKQTIREYSAAKEIPSRLPILQEDIEKPPLKRITKKAIIPTEEEIKRNRRSRSAKLRIAEKQNMKI